jgi:HD-GYP domain-containing protein (c-di-GMP phosphodiesterase class II)
VAGLVWAQGQAVLVPDLDDDPRFKGLGDEIQYPTRSLLSCPLVHDGRVMGVVNVNNKIGGQPFDDDDRLALEAVAERVTRALVRFDDYVHDYQRLRDGQATLRAKLMVSRLRATANRRVAVGCGLETGRRLGLDEEGLRNLSYALHNYDLGLAEVSRDILVKPGPLTPAERELMHDHVRRGVNLVTELERSSGVRKIVQHHHENVDGSGYPHGSRGEAIPVGARIVRLVDSYCALVEARPYRAALDPTTAVEELQRGIGREYCPRVTPVFLEVLADRWDLLATAGEPIHASRPKGADRTESEVPEPVAILEDR